MACLFLTEAMDQQEIVKIQEKFSKTKKWLAIWGQGVLLS
jgi:hypothetical protein